MMRKLLLLLLLACLPVLAQVTTSPSATGVPAPQSNVAITGGSINSTPIGATTASTGAFTTLQTGAVNGGGTSIQINVANVNFNATGDTPVTITLPTGFTTYNITGVVVTGLTGTFGTGKIGIYSAASQGGQVLVAQVSPTITVGANTIGNGASLALAANVSGTAFTLTTLYVNIGTVQSGTSTANVTLAVRALY